MEYKYKIALLAKSVLKNGNSGLKMKHLVTLAVLETLKSDRARSISENYLAAQKLLKNLLKTMPIKKLKRYRLNGACKSVIIEKIMIKYKSLIMRDILLFSKMEKIRESVNTGRFLSQNPSFQKRIK